MVLCGIILSGPVAVGIVEIWAPQPAWRDAATFVHYYSWFQTLPYLYGFVLVGGFVAFMSVGALWNLLILVLKVLVIREFRFGRESGG